MKYLLLMRHAKSSWADESLSDHDRPLNQRGKSDAPRMGRLLAEEELIPDRILSSTAMRAAATAEIAAQAAGYNGDIEYLGELYHADPDTIVDILKDLDETYSTVMLVAHNPGLEEFVSELSDQDNRMPTGAIAFFRLEIAHWQESDLSMPSQLVNIWRPKEL